MRGIILAGGSGGRLHPMTLAVPKELLPVGDKPMIYYPLSVLMLAGIREILIIAAPADIPRLRHLLGDGGQLGLRIDYRDQPGGTTEAVVLAADHIGEDPVALIHGDHIFHGQRFYSVLAQQRADLRGCVLFGSQAAEPGRCGAAEADEHGRLLSVGRRPVSRRGLRAVTGLGFYDNEIVDLAKNLPPTGPGEPDLAGVHRAYLSRDRARLVDLGRGFAWLETETPESLLQAGHYVRTLEERQGARIACVEEIALRMGFISAQECHRLGERLARSPYGEYVMAIAAELAPA
ncbi:sugar phosphate nucleotidyltransferase [Crossiella sp. SN42]|uniref:sugar nucleotidyltransferase n=1 Tax=Crossiella sp. SN42 TaxID=2944808 RepID=UPI00207C5310|nr:sugar phosphate nucleotidyltransferase [Crossiella sp. SN42]MCO1576038.1 sugar phosphate nucleotidyltransferase [Crossiella sp. SN42]